jgi:ketosteroid isomerase-like protein
MPEPNVEIVRRSIAALVAAQTSDDWDPVLATLDPAVEIDDLDISLDTEHYEGHDRFRKWVAVWNESWERWRLEDIEILPVGEDQVIALFLMVATGKGSGIELKRRDAVSYMLHGGKIVRMAYYNDQRQALEAVGLAPSQAQAG